MFLILYAVFRALSNEEFLFAILGLVEELYVMLLYVLRNHSLRFERVVQVTGV